jgi:hypothetical protein
VAFLLGSSGLGFGVGVATFVISTHVRSLSVTHVRSLSVTHVKKFSD